MLNVEGKPITLPFFISDIASLSSFLKLDEGEKREIESVGRVYPFRVPPYYAALMEPENPYCPIRLQAVPAIEELAQAGVVDPLGEHDISVTPTFLKRYPGRGVFLVGSQCAMYCRFCNRRRLVGRGFRPEESWEETLSHIEGNSEIREVILSGGDPLMLEPAALDYILSRLRRIGHIAVIRVSSRIPVVLPERVEVHRKAIARSAPIWFIVHINHPKEITPEFLGAVKAFREAGATIVSHTVLLRRVNDCTHILARLFERLVEAGIKPYYLFQLDDVIGATHFKVRLDTGLAIMRSLRASLSGLCMPQYAVDITGGLGKIPLEGDYIKERNGDRLFMENLEGQRGVYDDNGVASRCNECGICRGRMA
jgi:lysine 2,3-aminomutase